MYSLNDCAVKPAPMLRRSVPACPQRAYD